MRSFLKISTISSRAKSARRFTHAPRLVETVTSGEVVTMRRANSAVALADLIHDQAKTLLRRHRGLRGHVQRFRNGDGFSAIAARPLLSEGYGFEELLYC